MTTTLLTFIFVSVLQTVIFGFTLYLIRNRTQKSSNPSVTGYSESAAIKIAELEGAITQLKLSFQDVIDRVEKWTKRDSQREVRAEKKAESVLPTDTPIPEATASVGAAPGAGANDVFARLRAQRGY